MPLPLHLPYNLCHAAQLSQGEFGRDAQLAMAAKARFEDPVLLQQFQEVEKLPEDDKHVVKRLLDAFLMKKQLQALVR